MNRSMKKNLFFGLMALAGLFTSCSQDDTDASPTADSNQVSMSIGMPADFVKTRASAPATFPAGHTLRCILEVWTKDGSTRKDSPDILSRFGEMGRALGKWSKSEDLPKLNS